MHNFSRLAIGSVAKVLWAAAILDREPDLAQLKIKGYGGGKFDQILGIAINPPLSDHNVWGGTDQLVDFNEFMEQSSNKYAAVLLTLASSFESGSFGGADVKPGLNTRLDEDSFVLDRLYTERPPLRLALQNAGGDNKGLVEAQITSNMEVWPFTEALAELFDVAVTFTEQPKGEGRGDDLLDSSLWSPLLDHLYGPGKIPRNHPFYGVSPERENLAYNLISDYRTQYLSMILGGGESTWTNIKMCETFSRLVTGRKVESSIVKRIVGHNQTIEPRSEFEPLGMNPEARRILHDALVRVASPNGTARQLNRTLLEFNKELEKQGKVLGFFSKTGSPRNITSLPTQTQTVMNELIQRGALRLGRDDRIHYRDKGSVSHEKIAISDRQGGGKKKVYRYVRAIGQNPGDLRFLERNGLSPMSVVNLAVSYNESTNRRNEPFITRNSRLTGFSRTRQVQSTGAVFTFTMGIYDKAAQKEPARNGYLPTIDVNGHLPQRALTVSVIIETQGDSGVAMPITRDLLKEVLWNELIGKE